MPGLIENMLDRVLPALCLLCGQRAPGVSVCGACLAGLPLNEPSCGACGLPSPGGPCTACGACLRHPPPWRSVRAPLLYEFPVDALVRLHKYRGQRAAGRALAAAMLRHGPPAGHGIETPLIPVPLHASRETLRGFNQARDLATHLSRSTGAPLLNHVLRRRRRTPPQAGLDARSRRTNLRGAFAWSGPRLGGREVVIVDDVMTTGTTCAACTRTLLSAGAGAVDVWVAARAL